LKILAWNEAWALDWREVPDGDGVRFAFRMLSGEQLDTARQKKEAEALKRYTDLTVNLDAERLAAIQSAAPVREKDPLDSYDIDLLIRFGLADWDLKHPETGAPVPCDSEHKAMLTGRPREWAARQVLSLSERSEGEGNGSGST
jgi:hypothetical protein